MLLCLVEQERTGKTTLNNCQLPDTQEKPFPAKTHRDHTGSHKTQAWHTLEIKIELTINFSSNIIDKTTDHKILKLSVITNAIR